MKNLIKQILREQVSGIEIESGFKDFYDLFKEKYGKIDNFDQIFEELEKDIKKSPTPKRTITDRGMFCGMSLTDNVIISKSMFSKTLFGFIYVLFHEIAHQYQYKKYGKELLYELTTKEVSDESLNKLIKIEQVADRFGESMSNKYSSMFGLPKEKINSPYANVEYGKSTYKNLILRIQEEIKKGNITCVEQMETYMLEDYTKSYTPSYSYTGSSYGGYYGGGQYQRSGSSYDWGNDYEKAYSDYELGGRSGLGDDIGDMDQSVIDSYEDILLNLKYEINQEINELIGEVENMYGENGSNIFRDLLNQEGFKNFYNDNEYIQTDEPVEDLEELAFKVDEDFYSVITDLKKYIEEKLQQLMDHVEKEHSYDGVNILSNLIEKEGFDELWIEY